MPTGDTPLADRLAELEAEVEAAAQRDKDARHRTREGRYDAAADLTADLREFRDAVAFNKPTAPPPDERADRQRELTKAFCEAVIEGGFVFDVFTSGKGFAAAVTDPRIDAEAEQATRDLARANAALRKYRIDNADALKAEAKSNDNARLKAAFKEGDLDGAKELLGIGQDGSAAMTSGDLAPTRVAVAG